MITQVMEVGVLRYVKGVYISLKSLIHPARAEESNSLNLILDKCEDCQASNTILYTRDDCDSADDIGSECKHRKHSFVLLFSGYNSNQKH